MAKPPNDSSLRIVVLAGGHSAERDVSLRSGAEVASALEIAGHRVTILDPSETELSDVIWTGFDVCFIALHGGAGEDGRVQQELERLGMPYTGSSPAACQLAMSKSAGKERFIECKVPTLPYVSFGEQDSPAEIAARVEWLGYPLVIKPDCQGSSLGLAIVDCADDLTSRLPEALRYDGVALAEPLVRGREFTVAMLDERPLPLIEIVSPERIFSYEAKYHSSLTEYRFDCELPATTRIEIMHAARAAVLALGTSGLARVDLMLGHDNRVWVLEVNTVPGLTARSLAPQAALRAGLEMHQLCDLLVRQCLATTGAA